ncbi:MULTISPECIES: cyclic nucleotide-binding domain-containing protein [Stappiaceae]|jgi:CRP-like cAMP-binding protein|uniref:MlotiK1 channel n=3 Tax=Roseibium TaxID=150830 RepID=A0A0M6YA06_9HYPH|nr:MULTISPECIES: Crp/Fnr family transcriptional regulator [Stappiaceae]MCR9280212.1 Crp/Fnr family transcriptional regulator [Paracoccaceae bacterium]MEC9401727.1 Crp/Fnr family transcriptional regulator [Pseudomonadota bacterium]AMN54195.1 cyclic nucleotide-binding protein [Labrenzia sp. CP4]AQQ02673.1 cyclic nucleotide-binding protein [Roseibium aggregatum]EAV46043.1 putative transcriptional regulator protein [Stappia aggregata IAM 12614] [Roseibium aggregatum IAM 12614]
MTLETEVEALRKVPLFRGIDETKLRLLAFISDRTEYPSGERLCSQGEEGDCAFIILSGDADVLVDTPEGEKKVAQVSENSIVGEIAILCDVPRTATLVAANDMDVLTVSKDDFLKLLKEFPDISLEVMRTLALRLERTTRDLADARRGAASG